ncbi:PREDICTED: uncharacterized protein LOC108767573, partial [Trachymyrmex cornetzi]|uniref:uncharacterized protein LOC108767573 n=1 Tax=Trachymyrmex cornetzi TaxID=471704 RepID=UPI00084F823C
MAANLSCSIEMVLRIISLFLHSFIICKKLFTSIVFRRGKTMEQLPGKRAGTNVYVYDGYIYHMDKRCKGLYRCSSRRSLECYAILSRNLDGTYTLKSQHNHPANDTVLQEFQMKQEMRQMCRETVMKPKEIFDAVCRG